MNNFTYFYNKIHYFYIFSSLKELSNVTNIPISTLSSIKQRSSITALKKKCRELNIYKEIFTDSHTLQNSLDSSILDESNFIGLEDFTKSLLTALIVKYKDNEIELQQKIIKLLPKE